LVIARSAGDAKPNAVGDNVDMVPGAGKRAILYEA